MHALLVSGLLLAGRCSTAGCAAVSGDMTISSYQLYPENADYDRKRCLTYLSALYNSSVVAWNPKTNTIDKTITFPGLTENPLFHLSGVKVDPLDRLSIVVNAGDAFTTTGADISGDNFLVKYDLPTDKILWQANLTAATDGMYGGFQDVAHDFQGTSFALGTFSSSLIRVPADGQQPKTWYVKTPVNHTVYGFSGIVASHDGTRLIVADGSDGQLYRFEMAAEQGTPELVPLSGAAALPGSRLDGVSIPVRWGGKVILVSDNLEGTYVLYSADASWNTAEFRGTVPNGLVGENFYTTATVQVADSVYSVNENFLDTVVPGTLAGSRSKWPLIDITAQIEALL